MDALELKLVRHTRKEHATFGDLSLDGHFECHTLEDVVRLDDPSTPQNEGMKIPHETAIPAGRYQVILNMSPKYKKVMPRLLNVPGFEGILIHKGNRSEDTWGCILVGDRIAGDDFLAESTAAFTRLFQKLSIAQELGKQIWITIENGF